VNQNAGKQVCRGAKVVRAYAIAFASARASRSTSVELLQGNVEFEHRRLGSSAPAAGLPVGAHELHVGMLGQIEQQGCCPR